MRSRSELLNEESDDCHYDNMMVASHHRVWSDTGTTMVCVCGERKTAVEGQYDKTGMLYQNYQ